MFKFKRYDLLGGGAGFFVSEEDLNYVPLSKARAERAWIGINGELTAIEWTLGSAVHIPNKHYWKIVDSEKEGEIGRFSIAKYIKQLKADKKSI